MNSVGDPWQDRLDRMRRVVPLPLLLLSTVAALVVHNGPHSWARYEIGLPVAAAAAVLWTGVTVRYHRDLSARWQQTVFWTHTVLAAVLVWVNLAYGVFAYTGFLFAYGLGRPWRVAGFAVTALIVSASLSNGYPSTVDGHAAAYLIVSAVLVALVLNSASITSRAVVQNQERGRTLDALAEANRRLEASMAENADLQARLLTQAREAGVVEERRRMAGEIHDTLAQGLTGIIAQLEAAEQTRRRPEEWQRHLDQARALARSSLTEARRSVRALRPEQLEDATLPEAIDGLTRAWSEQVRIAADLDTTGMPARVPADVEATLFRVAQEALSNVGKHAGASIVRLTLTYLEDTVLLDVVDDGVGFEPSTATGGYGLVGMRQRLARVGGTLTIESAGGFGTTLNAAVPLPGVS